MDVYAESNGKGGKRTIYVPLWFSLTVCASILLGSVAGVAAWVRMEAAVGRLPALEAEQRLHHDAIQNHEWRIEALERPTPNPAGR